MKHTLQSAITDIEDEIDDVNFDADKENTLPVDQTQTLEYQQKVQYQEQQQQQQLLQYQQLQQQQIVSKLMFPHFFIHTLKESNSF